MKLIAYKSYCSEGFEVIATKHENRLYLTTHAITGYLWQKLTDKTLKAVLKPNNKGKERLVLYASSFPE